MNYIYSFIIGYLLGSFPTAYLLLKRSHGLDITQNGSGNVGAMNSFEVTSSKKIGMIVLIVDALKGWLSAFITYTFFGETFLVAIVGIAAAVFSHCYTPWLKFKGGRGLATAAGGALFISIPVIIVWALNWVAVYLFSKSIHLGNFMATLFTAVSAFTYPQLMIMFSFKIPSSVIEYGISVTIIMIIILSKHIIPMRDYIKSLNNKKEQ
ncbi:MAG: glycerol-3-phosphate acyltransferase [Melioribacteraceae bacterium]